MNIVVTAIKLHSKLVGNTPISGEEKSAYSELSTKVRDLDKNDL